MTSRTMHGAMARITRRPNLAEQSYNALCDGIVSGALPAGERIVLERLARDLGVSPTPLREAIARLVQEGLVVSRPGGKLHVVPLTPSYIHDAFWVRASLEGLAAELAAPRIADSALTEIEDVLNETTLALQNDDLAVYVRSDVLLHRLIAESADNHMLLRELDVLKTHIAFIRGYSQRHAGDHIRKSHEEHLVVFEFLKKRDAERVRRAVEAHIRRTSERIVRLIEFVDEGTNIHPSEVWPKLEEVGNVRY